MPKFAATALAAALLLASPPVIARDLSDRNGGILSPGGNTITTARNRAELATDIRNKNLRRPSWGILRADRPDKPSRISNIQPPVRPHRSHSLDRPQVLDRPHVLDRPQILDRPHKPIRR